uniref:GPI ethanolamine phosphate transferase 2 C-terminal domain-containing protein n=1 Tax=Caenorhabditis japonica TaxID=281687 RepID=A0A8R1IPU6_CAEJA
MTPFGSHGGASPDETRVPAIIWKINGQNEGKKSPVPIDQDALKIEQIDISATIFDIFGMPPPPESYGISLSGIVGSDTDKTIKRQHEHFKNLVKVKQLPISDVCEGECDFSSRFIQSALKKWFREVQEKLIGSASEVPNFSLFTCIFILTIAISISIWTSPPSEWTDALIFLFNVSCFASSLIEEEHEIWYFLTSTLIVSRIFVNLRDKRRRKEIIHWIILGVLHRISFGFVQSTRRRWSMDPNLLPLDVFSNSLDFKVKDLNGYFSENALLFTFISLVLWITVDKNYLIIFPLISHSLRIMGYSLFDAYFLTIFRLSLLPYFYFFRRRKMGNSTGFNGRSTLPTSTDSFYLSNWCDLVETSDDSRGSCDSLHVFFLLYG